MSTTIVAEIVTADGVAAWPDAWAGPGWRQLQATPPDTFGDWLPGELPVTVGHDGRTVGLVDYAEVGLGYGNGGLFCVAVLEGLADVMIDGRMMCSPEIRADTLSRTISTTVWSDTGRMRSSSKVVGRVNATRAELKALALVHRTAGVCAAKVRAWPGDYRDPLDPGRWDPRTVPPILTRATKAAATNLRYSRPDRLRIHRPIPERGDEMRYGGGGELRYSAPYAGILEVR